MRILETRRDWIKVEADGLRSGNFVKQPQVTLVVLQVRGNQASVLGMVNRPGRYPLEMGVTRLSDLLAAAGGDTAQMALSAGFVDGLKGADEWRDFLRQQVGPGADGKGFKHLDLGAYVARLREEARHPAAKVGVVVAQGAIVDGEQPPGVTGGDTVAGLIRQAREDEAVKAVVLRIDRDRKSVV